MSEEIIVTGKTVEEAMGICKKENSQKIKNVKKIVKEDKPSWYGKELEEEKASEEDIKKLEAMLNER